MQKSIIKEKKQNRNGKFLKISAHLGGKKIPENLIQISQSENPFPQINITCKVEISINSIHNLEFYFKNF